MAKCEWSGVDCPPQHSDRCSTRPRGGELLNQLNQAEEVEDNETAFEIEGQLLELAKPKCTLEKELSSELEMDDFTEEQLALVGAKKIKI